MESLEKWSDEVMAEDSKVPEMHRATVAKVREVFLARVAGEPGVSQVTVDSVRHRDWFVYRYLMVQNNVEATVRMLEGVARWRHDFGVDRFTDAYFAAEFYTSGAAFRYEADKRGFLPVYLRIARNPRISALSPFIKQFLVYQMVAADELSNGRWALIFDFSGCGLRQMDLDMMSFVINTLRAYFPMGLMYILAYDLPPILRRCWALVEKWIPRERRNLIHFANRETITDWIERKNLPPFMGGTCTRPYTRVPAGCKTAELLHDVHGLSNEQMKACFRACRQWLEDGKTASAAVPEK